MIKKLNTIGKWLVWLYIINVVWGIMPSLIVWGIMPYNSSAGPTMIGMIGIILELISTTIPIIILAFVVWHPDYPWMHKAVHVSILVFMIIMFLPNNHMLRTNWEWLQWPYDKEIAWGYSLFPVNMFISALIGTLANIITGIIAYYYAFKKQEGKS